MFITAVVENLYIDCSMKKRKCRNSPESSENHIQKLTFAPDFRVSTGAKGTRNDNKWWTRKQLISLVQTDDSTVDNMKDV